MKAWKKGAIVILLISGIFVSKFWWLIHPTNLPEIEDLDGEISLALNKMEHPGEFMHDKQSRYKILLKYASSGRLEKSGWDEIGEIEKIRRSTMVNYWHWKEVHNNLRYLKSYSNILHRVMRYISYKRHYPNLEKSLMKSQNAFEIYSINIIKKEIELEKLLARARNGEDVSVEYDANKKEISKLDQNYVSSISTFKKIRRDHLFFSGVTLPKEYWLGVYASFEVPLENSEYYFSNFTRDKVWVGLYETPTPEVNNFIGEYCDDNFTVEENYYWREALKEHPNVQSIRIRWYYTAFDLNESPHSFVWEERINETNKWFIFAKFNSINPKDGNYAIVSLDSDHIPLYDYCIFEDDVRGCNSDYGEYFGCDLGEMQYYYILEVL